MPVTVGQRKRALKVQHSASSDASAGAIGPSKSGKGVKKKAAAVESGSKYVMSVQEVQQMYPTINANEICKEGGSYKYVPMRHIKHRYPGKTGLVRLKCIYADYVLDRNYTAAYFCPSTGARALDRHGQNQRGVSQVEEQFARDICTAGVRSDMRGKPIITPKTSEPECVFFRLVGAGTMAAAVYLAVSREPNNIQVKLTVEQGLENAILIIFACPEDVIQELMFVGNIDHNGTASTAVQGWEVVRPAEMSWNAFKNSEGISKRSCPQSGPLTFAKRQESHILEEYHHIFSSGDQFDNARESHNKLVDCNIYGIVIVDLGKTVIWNHKAMPDNSVIWLMANSLMSVISKNFKDLNESSLAMLTPSLLRMQL